VWTVALPFVNKVGGWSECGTDPGGMPTRNLTGNRQWPYCLTRWAHGVNAVLIRDERRPDPKRRNAVALPR